jgi:phenylpropionate dioxygenase-like ring-hydroxylating dioxygenase large terminal subunit
VPFGVEVPDRIPKERYVDRSFFDLEAEQLWPRVWQTACRLEEIPNPFDYAEYEILDQSVVVVRTEDGGVTAFQNACRHRGVKVALGHGTCERGFTCPFHGWCYQPDGSNKAVTRRRTFSEHNLRDGDLDLAPVRCDTWGGWAWINFDAAAPPLRDALEPLATSLDAWHVESLRAEWWYACRLPVNWKLGIEAFVEAYHVVQTHPQLVIPTRYGTRDAASFDAKAFVDADIRYLRAMSEGMAGMVHANDVRIAERLRDIELPGDPDEAVATWNRTLNDAVTSWHRDRGSDIPDLNGLTAQGLNLEFFQGFPNFFVLPMYSSASSYRFRPLGPEETLMEIWSLTRVPEGEDRPPPTPPEAWAHDDPRWPPIPAQDFSNIPRQQLGLHARAFEYMRLSEQLEGHISNFERTIDGFLAGRGHDELRTAVQAVNVYPFDRPIVDLGFGRSNGQRTRKRASTRKTPAKKAVAKKTAAKKTVAKKTVAKKTVAKKTTAKKAVAKKSVAKRATAKRAVAKKATAKKAVAKKTTAKKAAPKKNAAKKAVAKRTTTRKRS